MPATADRLPTTRDVAARLNRSRDFVCRLCRKGLVPGAVAVLVSLLEVMRDTTDRPSLYDECNAALDGVTLED